MDSTLNLAFSMHKNPGVYALLLGSGVSRSVGIPTGWDVTQDLIRQIKELSDEELPEDTGYDELLEALAPTPTERNAFLRPYVEPTDEEREQGIKVPSLAHRAIAELIKEGFIKVVLTTNFDRLLEIALEEIGITPDVVRSDDMLQGMRPLRHSPITIIQLHGDYQDTRTLNTSEELENYKDAKLELLEIIFDEYGLIVCGWSATWDTALRKALLRAKTRRYSTYWVEPFDLSDEAQDLIQHRRAELIEDDADSFFSALQEKVEALGELNREHPLAVAVAVERVKKLIPYPEKRIELEDLLRDEAETTNKEFVRISPELPTSNKPKDYAAFYKERFVAAVTVTETMLSMAATLCWYGNDELGQLITEILNLWGQSQDLGSRFNKWKNMPVLALMYVCGIAAVRQGNWGCLHAATISPSLIMPHSQKRVAFLKYINKHTAFDYKVYNRFFDDYDPVSNIMMGQMRPFFKRLILLDDDFRYAFDLYEHLVAVITLKYTGSWLRHNAILREYASSRLWDDIAEFYRNKAHLGKDWGFLTQFFDGNEQELAVALGEYREEAKAEYPRDTVPDFSAAYLGEFENS